MNEEINKILESYESRIRELEEQNEVLNHRVANLEMHITTIRDFFDRIIGCIQDIDCQLQNQKQHIQILETWVNNHE